MAHPTSFRPEPQLGKRLAKMAKATGFSQTDLLEIGLKKFFKECPTTDAVIEAVVEDRKERARG